MISMTNSDGHQQPVSIVNDGDDIGGGFGPGGFNKEDALVLTADATATLIGRGRGGGGEWGRDDADGRRRQQ